MRKCKTIPAEILSLMVRAGPSRPPLPYGPCSLPPRFYLDGGGGGGMCAFAGGCLAGGTLTLTRGHWEDVPTTRSTDAFQFRRLSWNP